MPFPPVVGRGVLIDRLVPDDATTLARSHSDPANARYQGWQSPLSEAEARRFIEAQTDSEPVVPGSGVQLAIRETAGGPLVGDLYVARSESTPGSVEVGITLVPGFHGRGLATSAIAAVLDDMFERAVPSGPVSRVVAVLDAGNIRSRALFERLGFRLEAHHRGSGRRRNGTLADELVFVMTDRRWHAARRPHRPGDRETS